MYSSFIRFVVAFAVVTVSTPIFADNPPYGPVEDPWANCTDTLLDNETTGLLGVSCAAIFAPDKPITPAFVRHAKNICIKQPRGVFGEINGQYICLLTGRIKTGQAKPNINQFSAEGWKQFKWIAGRVPRAHECPPHGCNEPWRTKNKVASEPLLAAPTGHPTPTPQASIKPPPYSSTGPFYDDQNSKIYTKPPVIDVNNANIEELNTVSGLRQARDLIILLRSQRPFVNAQDFAERVCGRASVDSGFEAIIKIGDQQLSPRGGEPKAASFKCTQGGKTYHTEGVAHDYVGHVTLLR